IASQASARAGSLTPAALGDGRLREVHHLPALLLGGVLQLLARLLQVGRLLLRGPLGLGIRVPGHLPSCLLGLALGCLGGVPGLSALAHQNLLLLPRCRIRHQRTPVGFPGPERSNPSRRGPGGILSRYRSSRSRMRPWAPAAELRPALPTPGPDHRSPAL